MAYNNYYRVVIKNDFLGLSKEITAPTRYELDRKVENQKRIWDEKVKREVTKQNKDEMKKKAERLTETDENKMNEYKRLLSNIKFQTTEKYYEQLKDKREYERFNSKLHIDTIDKVYDELGVPQKSWIEIFMAKKKNYRIKKEEEAKNEFKKRIEEYKKLEKEKEEYEKQKKYL